jgi:ribosomal protein S18 acetylase RimI-like enzyme
MPPGRPPLDPKKGREVAVSIRLASREDLDCLAAIEAEVFGIDAYDRKHLCWLVSREDCRVHVAEAECAIRGFAVTEILPLREFAARYGLPLAKLPRRHSTDERVAYFKSIAVHPGYRRCGAGRALHEARASMLVCIGITSIFVIQMPRPGLPAFHSAMGFSNLCLIANRCYRSGGQGAVWHRFVTS